MSSGGGASGEERCLSEIYRTVFVFILRERLPYVLLLVSVLYSLQSRYNRARNGTVAHGLVCLP